MEEIELRYLKGIGPKREKILNRLNIYSVKDLLYYFPLRYEDRRKFHSIDDLKEGEVYLVKGKVIGRNVRKPFKGKNSFFSPPIFEILLSDGKGVVWCVWFNQVYLENILKVNDEIMVYGKVQRFKGRLQFNSPQYEKIEGKEENSLDWGRIVGVYRLTKGINQKNLRKIIFFALKNNSISWDDSLPFYIRQEKKFPNIKESLENIHFPEEWEKAKEARERFIFEELFFSQILVYLRKIKHRLQRGISFKINERVIEQIRTNISFSLTSSQERVLKEILEDMQKVYPMQRLLQGDVGCGKTVVACFAMGVCVDNNYQAALMAPTEILVYQHYHTLTKIFRNMGFNIGVLTSSLSKKEKKRVLEDLSKGKINIIVGTHAMIEENVRFASLGLVVIDEQHKFGVEQRALLSKKGENPDCLIMSATPIPRSLALSLYGDLDPSVIDELPPLRKEPHTFWVEENKRGWVYNLVKKELSQGRQAFIIYPLIEESVQSDLKSLKEMYERIKEEFKGFKVEVFHGKLTAAEKKRIGEEFRQNKIQILISTTVVEVGVNVENASVMVVENPERFGLAQLHQLRGRVRRSIYQPYFVLISKENISSEAKKRLEIISKVNDGFTIAEKDLELRGPGDFFGHYQHGFPTMQIANPIRDLKILQEARRAAYYVVKKDPYLKAPYHRSIKEKIKSLLSS